MGKSKDENELIVALLSLRAMTAEECLSHRTVYDLLYYAVRYLLA